MDFSIRQATEKDYAGLNALLEEIDEHHRKALPQVFRKPDGPARTRDFLSGALADQNAVIFVAEIQAQIIGLVYAYVRSIPDIPIRVPCRAGEIDMIVVAQKYRRCGVGKALMETVHQWADQMKLDRLELSVWAFNEGARDFYRELDYEPAFIRMWKTGSFLPGTEA
jgi:ribosomal protein S18 acetylase RimI-like enzyme